VAGPRQTPPPLPYLEEEEPRGYAIDLSVELSTEAMRAAGAQPHTISRTNFAAMYWSMGQQLAHLSSNGARVRAGDMCGSGTISGSEPGSYGSLIELTWRGARPLTLGDGSARAFLEDGDSVVMRGWCGGDGTAARIGLGEVSGTILTARDASRFPG
jgi:fumarylacetoacetase